MAKFVAAYEASDLDSLVALLTDDVFISVPPLPFEYQGHEPASRFFASIFGSGRKWDFLQSRAMELRISARPEGTAAVISWRAGNSASWRHNSLVTLHHKVQ